MSSVAPRWTLKDRRIIQRDGVQMFFLSSQVGLGMSSDELAGAARRIVSLLNATELSDAAVATLGVCALEAAATERAQLAEMEKSGGQGGLIAAGIAASREYIGTLSKLANVLNHASSVYVILSDEPSIPLDNVNGEQP